MFNVMLRINLVATRHSQSKLWLCSHCSKKSMFNAQCSMLNAQCSMFNVHLTPSGYR